jgi:hypothetical protein
MSKQAGELLTQLPQLYAECERLNLTIQPAGMSGAAVMGRDGRCAMADETVSLMQMDGVRRRMRAIEGQLLNLRRSAPKVAGLDGEISVRQRRAG